MFYTPLAILTKTYHLPLGLILLAAEWSRKVFICYMCVSRFWVIVFPVSGKIYYNLYYTKRYLFLVWLVSIAVCMPFAITWSVCFSTVINQWGYCPWTPGWLRIFGLVTNFTPSILMTILYPICIVSIIRTGRKVNNPGQNNQEEGLIRSRERNLLYLFIINAVVFTIFWLPYYIYVIVGYKLPYVPEGFEFMRGVQTAYNPFIYYWLNPTIKSAINGLFKKTELAQVSQAFQRTNNSKAIY